MTDTFDVLIVGGSVAGATMAAFLARRGQRIAVVDRARFPRDKPCGEGLMPHGVEVLRELGVLDRVRATGVRELAGVRYTLDTGATIAARFPPIAGRQPVAFGVHRLALDTILLDYARASGDVTAIEGYTVRSLERNRRGGVVVSDGNREIGASVVVGADGLRSTTRRLLGWDASRSWPRRYAAVGHFALGPDRGLAPEVEVVLAAGMEAYVTPLGGNEALVALLGGKGLMQNFSGDLPGGFERVVRAQSRLGCLLDGADLLPGVRATGPFAARARTVAGRGALLVGDAAGFLDPITGEGMAAALLQARAAARVIAGAVRSEGVPDLSPYAAMHRRIVRTGTLLTWTALGLCASESLRERAIAGLQRRDSLFGKLLAINCGYAGLGAVTPREWAALLTGR